jgi:Ni/Co efflux regulator RcnB
MSRFLGVVIAASLLTTGLALAQDQPPGRPGDQGARPEAQPEQPQPAKPAHRPSRPRPGRPNLAHRPPHHFLSQGRYRKSIHARAFRYPPGFRYRHWAGGATLPRIFLSPAYYYDNYEALGLAAPPPGYRWVRYGPDLLLVNVVTGRIADVVEGVFY